jgi:hypothetical protein
LIFVTGKIEDGWKNGWKIDGGMGARILRGGEFSEEFFVSIQL